jgi:cysteine desulfurase
MSNTSHAMYFDHAASTPLDPFVVEAMRPYLETDFANPSSLYRAARDARGAVEAARHSISTILGAKPTEIVFTSGGTEGDNFAVQGILRAHPGASWVTTSIEHDAILACIEPLKRTNHNAYVIAVKPNGIVETSAVMSAVTDETVLVSVMMANNEVGTIQPLSEIARRIKVVRDDRLKRHITLPLYFHTDAVQATNYLDLHVARLGVDLLTINGSKIYGPKGIGALYVRHGTVIEPLIYGGGQERGRRSGTENVSGIVGLAKAYERAATQRDIESRRVSTLRDQLLSGILVAIPDVTLNGDPRRRLPNNVNITIPGVEGEALVLYLDNAGILASTGSACSTGNLEPSHVLLAIGRSTTEANASLRLTLGRSTTSTEVNAVITVLPGIVARLREL